MVIDSKVTNFLHSWVVIGAFNDLSSNFCAIRFSKTRLKFIVTVTYVRKLFANFRSPLSKVTTTLTFARLSKVLPKFTVHFLGN